MYTYMLHWWEHDARNTLSFRKTLSEIMLHYNRGDFIYILNNWYVNRYTCQYMFPKLSFCEGNCIAIRRHYLNGIVMLLAMSSICEENNLIIEPDHSTNVYRKEYHISPSTCIWKRVWPVHQRVSERRPAKGANEPLLRWFRTKSKKKPVKLTSLLMIGINIIRWIIDLRSQ
jgi:hypothetical protein